MPTLTIYMRRSDEAGFIRPLQGKKQKPNEEPVVESIKPKTVDEALQLLKDDFPLQGQVPVMFEHQITAVLPDISGIQQRIDCLRKEGVIRIINLPMERSRGIMFTKDMQLMLRSLASPEDRRVGSAFACLIETFPRSSISERELVELMDLPDLGNDRLVRMLAGIGVIVNNARVSGSYLISVPGIGLLVTSINDARKKVVPMFKLRPFEEALRHELIRKRLKSPLDWKFVLRDMVGFGLLSAIDLEDDQVLLKLT